MPAGYQVPQAFPQKHCDHLKLQPLVASYILFAHALIISAIAHVCVILENISEVSIMGVYKNTKISKNVRKTRCQWRSCWFNLSVGYVGHVAV